MLAGPYATQLLGDLGAEVWKIERPGHGDETRSWGPPFVAGESAYFLSVNRNKRSAALDFDETDSRPALLRAAARADIVVENFLPGTLARHGLDPAVMRRANPDLIVCSITGFGQDGPYASLPGYDAVMQGFVGLMSVTGEPGRTPLKVGVALVDVLTGVHAAVAMLAALVGRARGGSGAHLDISLHEAAVSSLVNVAQSVLATGQPARRHGNAHPHIVPYQTFSAADGLLVIAVGNDSQWRRLCPVLGLEALADDPRFAGNADRVRNREELVEVLGARLASLGRDEWCERLRAARVPCGPVREVHEVMGDPALAASGFLRSASVGNPPESVSMMGLPWRIDGDRPPLRMAPPRLGEHTVEFLRRFG